MYKLRGHVEIHYGTYALYADEVTFNSDTGEAVGEGHMVLDGGPNDEHIEASHGTYNVFMKFLEDHSGVAKVNYPGLESHPHHALARGMLAGFGGMVSFEVEGGVDATSRFLERLTIPIKAPSLGSVESLVTRPATTSHVGLPPDERRKLGISDSLVRLSIGIEDPADLVEDLGRALAN